jgi:hypothetical protein
MTTNLKSFPNPQPNWPKDDQSHPGYVTHGIDDTPGNKAYFIHLEAKPGKEELVENFLKDINKGVDQEPLTGPWFALRMQRLVKLIMLVLGDKTSYVPSL